MTWAPIAKAGQTDQETQDELKAEITQSYSTFQVAGAGTAGTIDASAATLSADFMSEFANHLADLRREDKRNFNIAKVIDPLGTAELIALNTPSVGVIPGKASITQPSSLATSYTTHNDRDYYLAGRDGYSVKLIPFSTALKNSHHDLKGDKSEYSKIKH